MTPRTKKLLLLLGGCVWLLLLTRAGSLFEGKAPVANPALRVGDLESAGTSGTRPGARRKKGQEQPTQVAELEISRLEAHGGQYQTGRNLFVFYQPPPPPPPKPKGPSPEELARIRAAEDAQRRAEEAARLAAEPPKPTPPTIDFSYLGSFGPDKRRVAVFSNGESLFNAVVGEVVEGKFRLVSIGYESVELAYVDFPDLRPAQLPVGQ